MDAESARAFRQSLSRALTHADAVAVDDALFEVGWTEALEAEGAAVIALLFPEQGQANSASSAIDDVLMFGLGLKPAQDSAVVLPRLGQTSAPAIADGGVVRVRGVASSRLPRATNAVVVVPAGDGYRQTTVAVEDLQWRIAEGVDPSLGLVAVTAQIAEAEAGEVVDWSRAVSLGQLALANELVGAARGALRLAREHALTRVQFGAPIASFQAVRHRLADALVAIESADALVRLALEHADGSGQPHDGVLLAGMAKAVAGRHARTVARHCQQVLAGIGFTTEHAFHHYLRRILALDGLLGDARTLTRRLGQHVVSTRRMPAAPPL